MPRTDEIYRGYRIVYLKDNHYAWMWAPGEALPMINVQQRWEGESFEVLRRRAHIAIDADRERLAMK